MTDHPPPLCKSCRKPLDHLQHESYKLVRHTSRYDWNGYQVVTVESHRNSRDETNLFWKRDNESRASENLGSVRGFDEDYVCPHCGESVKDFRYIGDMGLVYVPLKFAADCVAVQDEIRMEIEL